MVLLFEPANIILFFELLAVHEKIILLNFNSDIFVMNNQSAS